MKNSYRNIQKFDNMKDKISYWMYVSMMVEVYVYFI